MSSIEDLRELFESFCNFGSSRNLATGSTSNMDEMLLDGQKFAKLCKDAKIIDGKKITTTEVDIVFNKCKAKGQRKMDWDSFLVAFRSLAEKKYPSQNSNDAYRTLMGHVCDKCPIAHGTIPQTNGVYDKLTDVSGYTGTHKQRFNSDGTGKGIDGRDQPSKTKNLSTMVERTSGTVAANKSQPNLSGSSGRVQTAGTSVGQPKKRGQTSVLTASSDKLDVRSQQPKRAPLEKSNGTLKSQSNVSRSSGNVSENKNYTTGSNSNLKGSSGSVFDRLTDVNGYTGAHKHRFNADGSGRGLTGRDAPSLGGNPGPYRGGDVKDLSQILRS